MANDRMSAAEFRALAAGKPKAHGSKRGTQGTAVGTCRVCGKHVSSSDQAWFHADIHADGSEERWVEHQACHTPRDGFGAQVPRVDSTRASTRQTSIGEKGD